MSFDQQGYALPIARDNKSLELEGLVILLKLFLLLRMTCLIGRLPSRVLDGLTEAQLIYF